MPLSPGRSSTKVFWICSLVVGAERMGFVSAKILLGLRGDPCLGLLQIRVGLAAAHEVQPLEAVRREHGGLLHDLRLHGDGQPHVGRLFVEIDAVELCGHDSDDGEGLAVDGDGAAD